MVNSKRRVAANSNLKGSSGEELFSRKNYAKGIKSKPPGSRHRIY